MRTHIYFDDNIVPDMDRFIKANSCRSRSELVNKAISFYMDYHNNKKAGTFLSREIEAIMTSNMELVEKRLGNRFAKLMSATAIQLGIIQQVLKSVSDITEDDIDIFRKIAVDEMRENQKILKYEKLEE